MGVARKNDDSQESGWLVVYIIVEKHKYNKLLSLRHEKVIIKFYNLEKVYTSVSVHLDCSCNYFRPQFSGALKCRDTSALSNDEYIVIRKQL